MEDLSAIMSSRAIQVQEKRCYRSVGLHTPTWDQELLSLGTFFLLWTPTIWELPRKITSPPISFAYGTQSAYYHLSNST